MADFIEVICAVFPSGQVLWFEKSKGTEYATKILDKWKKEHPEYEHTPCTAGMVGVTMPEDEYIKIGAAIGPGEFVFPE